MVKSKIKGNKFERDIAKLLGILVSNNPDAFCRNFHSKCGDIAIKDPSDSAAINFLKHFSIECKSYKNLPKQLWLFFAGEKNKISDFLAQAKRDAGNKGFILIMKSNNAPPIAVVSYGNTTDNPNSLNEVIFKATLLIKKPN